MELATRCKGLLTQKMHVNWPSFWKMQGEERSYCTLRPDRTLCITSFGESRPLKANAAIMWSSNVRAFASVCLRALVFACLFVSLRGPCDEVRQELLCVLALPAAARHYHETCSRCSRPYEDTWPLVRRKAKKRGQASADGRCWTPVRNIPQHLCKRRLFFAEIRLWFVELRYIWSLAHYRKVPIQSNSPDMSLNCRKLEHLVKIYTNIWKTSKLQKSLSWPWSGSNPWQFSFEGSRHDTLIILLPGQKVVVVVTLFSQVLFKGHFLTEALRACFIKLLCSVSCGQLEWCCPDCWCYCS